MNEIITTIENTTSPFPLPVPDANINVRPATREDMAFIDALQKQHSKQLGFFPRAQMEGYIDNGWVLVAEERQSEDGEWKMEDGKTNASAPSSILYPPSSLSSPRLLGYVASRDRYLKRDELGCIFQLCVTPGGRRKLIGATLLKAVFERAAYGTRLYCCWCAQDLKANLFWESMGFVPLAVRAGSEKGRKRVDSGQLAVGSEFVPPSSLSTANCQLPTSSSQLPTHSGRTHVFWQKRIRVGDESTPWWYPSGTDGGAMRAGRIVVPIPPGVSWREAQVPRVADIEDRGSRIEDRKCGSPASRSSILDPQSSAKPRKRGKKESTVEPAVPVTRSGVQTIGLGNRGLRFGMATAETPAAVEGTVVAKKAKRERTKIDPQVIARARELRDRWMEAVNAGAAQVALPVGKYEVGRAIDGPALRQIAA